MSTFNTAFGQLPTPKEQYGVGGRSQSRQEQGGFRPLQGARPRTFADLRKGGEARPAPPGQGLQSWFGGAGAAVDGSRPAPQQPQAAAPPPPMLAGVRDVLSQDFSQFTGRTAQPNMALIAQRRAAGPQAGSPADMQAALAGLQGAPPAQMPMQAALANVLGTPPTQAGPATGPASVPRMNASAQTETPLPAGEMPKPTPTPTPIPTPLAPAPKELDFFAVGERRQESGRPAD